MNARSYSSAKLLRLVSVLFALSACGSGESSSGTSNTAANVPASGTGVTIGVQVTTVAQGEVFVFSVNGQNVSVTQNATKTDLGTELAIGTNYTVTQVSGPRSCALSSNSTGTATSAVEVIATCGTATTGGAAPATPTNPPATSGRSYSGSATFDVALPTMSYTGTATVSYAYIGEFPDVKYYGLSAGNFTGTLSFPAQGCTPVNATLALAPFVRSSPSLVDFEKTNTLLVWTSQASAGYANTHSFDLQIAQGQSVVSNCPDGLGNLVPTTLDLGKTPLADAGLCPTSPVASWTDENQLSGEHACALTFINRVRWTLNGSAGSNAGPTTQ